MGNSNVKLNLERLFNSKFELIKNISVISFFEELINENPMAFDIASGAITGLYDENEIDNFKKAKKDPKLISAFEKAKEISCDEDLIVSNFKKDILISISEIKNNLNVESKNFKNQIIFLEHDYQPFALFCGFGPGNYPILEEPTYFDFNWQEELYCGVGKIDYSIVWNDFVILNEILEENEVFDQILDTDLYQNLSNSLKFKTYLLVHEAFKQLGIEIFNGIEIKIPLYIYGNEHDCEAINIFVFE